jgi:hypothetical protein
MELWKWIAGIAGVGAVGYVAFKPPPPPSVASGIGPLKVGDFVVVDGRKFGESSTLGPIVLPADFPAQARMRIESISSPFGVSFVTASFADTRITLPGIVNVPVAAVVARSA